MRVFGAGVAALIALSMLVVSVWGTDFAYPTAIDHPERALICLVLAAVFLAVPWTAEIRKKLSSLIFESRSGRFEWVIFTIGLIWYSILSFKLFQGIPHLDDAVASLFQAKVFASGNITLPLPEHAEFFRVFGVLAAESGLDHQVGMYPPGWPLLLAVGQIVGIPWIVNPILGGLLAVFTGRLGRELFSEDVGRMAAILCLCSPFLGVLHATHLSHTATALGGVVAWWAGIRMVRTGQLRWGLIAGLVLGLAFLCRPLTAAVCGVGLGLGLLFYVKPVDLLRSWKPILAAVIIVLGAAGTQLAFNKASTGDAFTAGHVVGLGRRGKMGFVKLDHVRTHTVELGVEYSRRRLVAMNQTLNGWPLPAMMLALVPLAFDPHRWRAIWLLLPLTGLILAYATFQRSRRTPHPAATRIRT